MKIKRNLFRNILATALSVSLVGCMSVDEMLASNDPYWRRSGEKLALDYIADKYGQTDIQRKVELANKIQSQDLLLKLYFGKNTPPEIKKDLKGRIPEDTINAATFIYSPDATARGKALEQTKSKESLLKTFEMLMQDSGCASDADIASLILKINDKKFVAKTLRERLDKTLDAYNHERGNSVTGSDDTRYKATCKEIESLQKIITSSANDSSVTDEILKSKFKTYGSVGRDYQEPIYTLNIFRPIEAHDYQLREKEREAKKKAREERELIAQKEQDENNAPIIEKAKAKVASFKQRWKELEPTDAKISSIKDKSQSHKSQTLVMKGFYLGMPLQDAMTLFWSYTHFTAKELLEPEKPDFWMEKYCREVEKSGERFSVDALRLRKNQDTDLLIANIIGLCARVDEQYCVTKLVFDRNMVDDMFGINNVDGKIFCQQLVENYPIIERMEYSTVQIEDEKARDRYLFGRVLDGSINMSNAFQAGYDTADMFKKWTDCYHYESKKGFRISVMAEEKESFLVLEKTQKVEKKNFD